MFALRAMRHTSLSNCLGKRSVKMIKTNGCKPAATSVCSASNNVDSTNQYKVVEIKSVRKNASPTPGLSMSPHYHWTKFEHDHYRIALDTWLLLDLLVLLGRTFKTLIPNAIVKADKIKGVAPSVLSKAGYSFVAGDSCFLHYSFMHSRTHSFIEQILIEHK